MSNWNSFINRICKQDAVYWGSPVNNGYGSDVFAEPVEIKVRWEHDVERQSEKYTEEDIPNTRANIKIISPTVLEKGGYLKLGLLTDITGDNTNPVAIDNAWKIQEVGQTPTISGRGTINEYAL